MPARRKQRALQRSVQPELASHQVSSLATHLHLPRDALREIYSQPEHNMATERNQSKTAQSSGSRAASQGKGSSAEDIKQREYRDAEGNVHHHTRAYLEQHGGAAAKTSSSRSASKKASAKKSTDDNGGQSDEAADMEESEDELEAQINTLLALAQMDSEAAVAYETAAELIEEPDLRSQLQEFAGDHRRHIDDLGQLVEQLGGEAAAAAPPPENSTFVMFASALGALGTQTALLSLIGSEEFTNATYETALDVAIDPEARELLERNFADEQRHINWLAQQTQDSDDSLDAAAPGDG
jgi:rubrerythrin